MTTESQSRSLRSGGGGSYEAETCGLCQVCQKMFSSKHRSRQQSLQRDKATKEWNVVIQDYLTGTHHTHPRDCRAAALNGCLICSVVWERVIGTDDKFKYVEGHFTTYKVFEGSSRGHGVSEHLPSDQWILEISFASIGRASSLPGQFIESQYKVRFALPPMGKYDDPFTSETKSVTTASAESWDLVSQWLKDCLANHPKCQQTLEEIEFRPTRLIDVGSGDSSTVALREKGEILPNHRYVALSHRWGLTSVVSLADPDLSLDTLKNPLLLQDFKSGIAVTNLPKTFRDAITVTRRLHLRYLWIDAACILQNSPDDWHAESATMQEVYGSAFCTLAATSSVDGTGGLFHDRRPCLVNPVKVTPTWTRLANETRVLVPLGFWRVHVSEAG